MRFRVAVNIPIHRYEVLRMNFQLEGEIPVAMAGRTMAVGVIQNRIWKCECRYNRLYLDENVSS